jgi:hypothetical protein
MKRILVVHGMKRSGNHALISWLLPQDRFVFRNNIIPIARILRGEAALPPPEDLDAWLDRELPPRGLRAAGFLKRIVFSRHALLVSLEDHHPATRVFREDPPHLTNVLVLRDPKNLFASRIRKGERGDHPAYPSELGAEMSRATETWKTHAKEFLGATSHLANKVSVFFGDWFADESYRRELSRRLGLGFTDEGFLSVSEAGGGSSFDGTRFDGRGGSMNVLARQEELSAPERRLLDGVLADPELAELGSQAAARSRSLLFGDAPA